MLHSIKAKDYMTANLVTLSPDTSVMEAIRILLDKGISGAPVVDKMGRLVGLLSEKDCMRVATHAGYYGEAGGKVSEFMSPDVITVEGDTSVIEIAKMFMEKPFKRYPVMDDNRLIGSISRRDVLKAILAIHEHVW
ncbi:MULTISPECIES: CBS domain-containing protein [Abyssibacter]|uniref:CBS domain-containing protein n=1 Tax=Abyssibacter profundi TaxID=2182787 RepID=A0A363UQU4_9GAMM|nr:CBS domain-containing protein [Abyssibacter profundi]MBV60865.1 CBS domain-containing protein [Nevskiales bacterium]MEC9406482.1 CBS domain-containing protein [Pseudomonadota bacterium]PWN57816.1 CBS domain-containing protein [Abyssibacter profundi]